jgi:hypothetical protein
MQEIGTSGSISGDGKRSVGHRPQVTAPILDSTNSRHLDPLPLTSGLPQSTDIASPARLVRLVPGTEVSDRCEI